MSRKSRSSEIRFIKKKLTPMNPKDVFYYNYEELLKYYYVMILVGVLMIAYMLLR
jgi:hypothetical protein